MKDERMKCLETADAKEKVIQEERCRRDVLQRIGQEEEIDDDRLYGIIDQVIRE